MPPPTPRDPQHVVALLAAGGRGARFGLGTPKQYRGLAGKPVLRRTLEAFATHPAITSVLVVIHPEDVSAYQQAAAGLPRILPHAVGGNTRQESVLNGLEALAASPPDLVLIHDAARPFVSPELIGRIIDAAQAGCAVVPGLPATDSLKRVDAGRIAATVPRADVFAVQTPQAFPFRAILQAHHQARAAGRHDLTDDAAVAELAGIPVRVVEGDPGNIKITTIADLEKASVRLAGTLETRTGQGFDVHAFAPGDGVWLCGLRIPNDRALLGHSDADVGLHALTDAILGALADGDIGQHFPPSDPQWQGASSDRFLVDAIRRVAERGGRILHLDLTLICETPKIAPHRDAMRGSVAGIAGLDPGRVSIKATTSERLGFTGRGEGIAALAVATIQLPISP